MKAFFPLLYLVINSLVGHAQTPSSADSTWNCILLIDPQPEFAGGKKKLQVYMAKHLQYPQAARQHHIEGRVFVSFVIDSNGAVSQAQLLKGIGYGCDEEAIRLVTNLPRWVPGIQNGRKVTVRYNLPVWFSLPKPTGVGRP